MGKRLQNYLIRAYSRKLKRHATSLVFMPLANEYKRCGRLGDAMRLVRNGLRHYPCYTAARALSGELLFLSGKLEEAEGELKVVAERAPEHVLSRRLLLKIYQKFERYGDALQYAGELVKLCPESSAIYYGIRSDLEKKVAVETEPVKVAFGELEGLEFSTPSDTDSLRRLERLYSAIKSESELRGKESEALKGPITVDWQVFQDGGDLDSVTPPVDWSACGKEKGQLEVFEKMVFNIKKRAGRDI